VIILVTFLMVAAEIPEMSTFRECLLLLPHLPPKATPSALSAPTSAPSVVAMTVAHAIATLECASARMDGLAAHARTAEAAMPRPPTEPLELADALSAPTRTPSAVVKTEEHATARLEIASARTDGPEVLALEETVKLELQRTTLPELPTVMATPHALLPTNRNATKSLEPTDALSAPTRTPSAVAMTEAHATARLVTASARMDGPGVLAPLATAALATSPMGQNK